MTRGRRRSLRWVLAAAVAPLMALAPGAAQAATDPSDGGLWYYSATGLEQLHQRSTGAGITIAVIDTSVNPAAPDLVGADVTVREPAYCPEPDGSPGVAISTAERARHGTHISALIVGTGAGAGGAPGTRGVAPGARVEVFALGTQEGFGPCSPPDFSRAFQDAVASGADIINVSGSYEFSDQDMLAAYRAGVIVVASAGNEGIVDGSPASYNGVVTVGTLGPGLELAEGSPLGGGVDVVAPGAEIRGIAGDWQRYGVATGSSDSAAFVSGALALAWSLYPDATANQIQQSLVRTTDGTEHEPVIADLAWGYGAVNVRQLLDSDPRAYPDVNPFVDDDEDAYPSVDAIREAVGGTGPGASAVPTPDSRGGDAPSESEPQEPSEGDTVLPVILGVVAVVLVLGVVTVVLIRRRTEPGREQPARSTSGGHDG